MFRLPKRKFQTGIAIVLAIVMGLPPAAFATAFNLGAFWKKKIALVVPSGWVELPGPEFSLSGGGGGGGGSLYFGPKRTLWTGTNFLVIYSSLDNDGNIVDGTTLNFFDPTDKTWSDKHDANHGYLDSADPINFALVFAFYGIIYKSLVVQAGSKVVFWGATNPVEGFFYDIDNDSWTTMNFNGAPVGKLGSSAVSTGTSVIIWGGAPTSGTISATGGIFNPNTNQWQATSTNNAPSARSGHTAIWTGQEMIIWGGVSGSPLFGGLTYENTGARYNPTTDSWTATSTSGAPTGRFGHTAVWTGQEMIIWGGRNNNSDADGGARYNPTNNTWSTVSTVNAPSARRDHHAFWTGSKMLVWGGISTSDSSNLADGALYDPATNSWSAMANPPTSVAGAVAGSTYFPPAVAWSGSKLLVWNGGISNSALYDVSTNTWESLTSSGSGSGSGSGSEVEPNARYFDFESFSAIGVWAGSNIVSWGGMILNNGFMSPEVSDTGEKFNPTTGLWSSVSTVGAPEARYRHALVSTGAKVLVWGGETADGDFLNSGGVYDVAGDSWTSMSTTGAPTARSMAAATWTNGKLFIWGGMGNDGILSDGGFYDLNSNSWTSISSSGAPSDRYLAKAFWTGSKVIVWGGFDENDNPLADGAMYDPSSETWSPISGSGSPSSYAHAVAWSGTHLVVWGGQDSGGLTNTGAKYDPQANSWSSITTTGAPDARMYHTAVNIGGKVAIWGGTNESFSELHGTGAIYDPVADSWTPLTNVDAPEARFGHVAVWSGVQMHVWGGFGKLSEGGVIFAGGGSWAP